MKSIIGDLDTQIAHLSTRITFLSSSAQEYLRNKNRVAALAALRSKKLNETTLKQRSDTLAQLEEVYGRIEQASDHVNVIRVMEDSTAVLRNLQAELGGVDRVEDVVTSLRDEMTKVNEVSTAIEAGAQSDNIIDEIAVDEELEAMARQAKLDKEKAQATETQTRLASIDKANRVIQDPEPQKLPLAEGIEAFKRLSLEQPTVPDAKTTDPTSLSNTAEKVAELGSVSGS